MKLSVIIVSQNACKLLTQALNSLVNACKSIDCNLIVVYNASTDKVADILLNEYPEAHIIAAETGVSIAGPKNQALKNATGEYILMVNADTISGKDSVE